VGNRDHPLGHATLPVADSFLQSTGFLLDLFIVRVNTRAPSFNKPLSVG
jgi:hypothetical protein